MKHILKANGDIINTNSPGFEWLGEWAKEHPNESTRKKRVYRITKNVYRKIAGAAKELFLIKKNNITFWTFTSPRNIEHCIFNKIMSDILENLRKNYGLTNYVGVAEYQKRGCIHYHFLLDLPFVDIRSISAYVVNVGNRYNCRFASNSVRLPPSGGVVQTSESITNYICKYMTKADVINTKYNARCYFMTHSLNRPDLLISEKEHDFVIHSELCAGQTNYDYITVTHTSRERDFYAEIRRERTKQRVYYDDFIQKQRQKEFYFKAKQGYLDLFGTIAGRNHQREKEQKQFEILLQTEKDRERAANYKAWKENYRERQKNNIDKDRKKDRKQKYIVEDIQNNTVFKYVFDRETGEYLQLYQWFRVYDVEKYKKKRRKSEKMLLFA